MENEKIIGYGVIFEFNRGKIDGKRFYMGFDDEEEFKDFMKKNDYITGYAKIIQQGKNIKSKEILESGVYATHNPASLKKFLEISEVI